MPKPASAVDISQNPPGSGTAEAVAVNEVPLLPVLPMMAPPSLMSVS